MQPPIEPCPERVPVVTMEQLVRNEPGGPGADDPIVIRGRLVSFHNRMWPILTSHNDCGYGRPLFALEAPIEGTCYGLGLSGTLFGCELDDTRSCCDHLPLGKEVALVGTYSPTSPGIPAFTAWVLHARICTLPEDT
jgi:hypothetical protein